MKTKEPQIDALTAAYVAIGAARALDEARANGEQDAWERALTGGGESQFMDEVLGYARFVDEAWVTYASDGRFEAAFDYEVSEPFGAWLAHEVMTAGFMPTEYQARAKIMELMAPGLIPDSEEQPPEESKETLVSADCGCGMFDCCTRCAP